MKAMWFVLVWVVACGTSHSDASTDAGLDGDWRGDSDIEPSGDAGPVGDGGSLGDAGPSPTDAGPSPTDAGPSPTDAGVVDSGGPGMGGVGTPCTTDDDCDGRFCSPSTGGLGYCTWVCAEDVGCPDDAVCVLSEGTVGYCLLACDTTTGSCPMGSVCYSGFGVPEPVCTSGCTVDGDCPTGTVCGDRSMGYGRCLTPSAENGSPCVGSEDCPASSFCADEAAWGFAGGLCMRWGCTVGTDVGCGPATTCVSLGAEGTICLPNCMDAAECRAGYECVPSPSAATDVCLPRCSADSQCTGGRHCDFLTSRCVDW